MIAALAYITACAPDKDEPVNSLIAGFPQEHKSKIDNPLLTEEDGPVYQLRRWYDQFYVDVADIDPKMVRRFEFEVDTTKADEAWEAEVAENMRQRGE